MTIEEAALNGNTERKSLILNAFVETCKSSGSDQSVLFARKELIDCQAVDISRQDFGAISRMNQFDSMI